MWAGKTGSYGILRKILLAQNVVNGSFLDPKSLSLNFELNLFITFFQKLCLMTATALEC